MGPMWTVGSLDSLFCLWIVLIVSLWKFDRLFATRLKQCIFKAHMHCIIISIIPLSVQIDKKAMHKSGMVQRVNNEVEIQCRLKHPSILEVSMVEHFMLDMLWHVIIVVLKLVIL